MPNLITTFFKQNSTKPRIGWGITVTIYLAIMGILQLVEQMPWMNGYYLHVLTIVGLNIILVASLNLVNGFLGEFALAHAGFMCIGAYTAAVLASKVAMPSFIPGFIAPYLQLILALVGGFVMAGLIGYLVGLLTFKTVGDYLAIITLGFNMIILNVIQNMEFLGGPRGYVGIPKNTNHFIVSVCVVLTFFILRRLIFSNYGRTWLAIRENSIAAELMGVNINKAKNLAFTVAAAFAGLAGGLLSQYQQYINPSMFDYSKITDILVMLYLGGMGSLSGSILGATSYTILMEILRMALSAIAPQLAEWRMLISPLVLVIIMRTSQSGLLGHREWRWMRAGKEVNR